MSEARTSGAHEAHLTSVELALYVIDALDSERKGAVESHVFSCDECADGLAREARVEAAFEQVARVAGERLLASVESILPAVHAAAVRARLSSSRLVPGARRSRWAGGVGGALAAAAALVLAFASATAHSEPAGVAQRAPGLHDAAGDLSGAFGGEVVPGDTLDGG